MTLNPPEADPAVGGLAAPGRQAARAGFFLARSYLVNSAYQRKVPGANEAWLQQAEQDRQKAMGYWLDESPGGK